jgi:formate dehydrogenase beta subunit
MSSAGLEIRAISGHAGPVPGAGLKREFEVCKLIDTTTCIGCKACEVACLEWNGYSFSETKFDNSYQTMPETSWNYWNLIKFNEHEDPDHGLMLLMRKDQCMHCEEPGCLAACPADNAIVQYVNGIVDFQQEHCIGCGYCISGCPFNIPKFSPDARKVFKCTLCVDRVSEGLEPACIKACPTGCLHFGTKPEMKELAETRAEQLREHSGFANAGVYDPAGISGTHVIYVLHDASNPENYGGLPSNPRIPWTVQLWKHPLKWIGNLAIVGGLLGLVVHYLRFGPKTLEEDKQKKPTRKCSALFLPGATGALAGGLFLRLPHADGPGVLVALALLAGLRLGRGHHISRAAFVGWLDLRCCGAADVPDVAQANARDGG